MTAAEHIHETEYGSEEKLRNLCGDSWQGTTIQLLEAIPRMLAAEDVPPCPFRDRIIMSMYNDTDWGQNCSEEVCKQNTTRVETQHLQLEPRTPTRKRRSHQKANCGEMAYHHSAKKQLNILTASTGRIVSMWHAMEGVRFCSTRTPFTRTSKLLLVSSMIPGTSSSRT